MPPMNERSPQTPILTILSHSTFVDSIYAHLSVPDILNLQKVSWQISQAVRTWLPAAYSVENHLRRFFENPRAFRVLQAQTGTIVSGSNALQFFERSYYPDSDLDLYAPCRHSHTVVKWLQANNYVFRPTPKQTLVIEETVAPPTNCTEAFFAAIARRRVSAKHGLPTPLDEYGSPAIEEVYTFMHREKAGLKVQLIVVDPRSTPVASVLYFHTTIVMNFITYDKAYSLFPAATFLTRTCLTLGNVKKDPTIFPAYAKYWRRGFKISALPLNVSAPIPGFKFNVRWTDDKQSWVIKLPPLDIKTDTAIDVDGAPTLQMDASELTCRTLETHVGFTLLHRLYDEFHADWRRNPDGWNYGPGSPAIYFREIHSPVLKTALVAPLLNRTDFLSVIQRFLQAQEEFEKDCARDAYPDVELGEGIYPEGIEGWKFWDDEVLKMWPPDSPGHWYDERHEAEY